MTQKNYQESPSKDALVSEQTSNNGGAPDAVEGQRAPRRIMPPSLKPPPDPDKTP